jgi:tRNA U34 5-methylaminomethyl-2-thiouridine-forming methyltransferase MnmC
MPQDVTFTPEATGDGSSTFFSAEFGEWFHSRQGAIREAQQTYVTVTRLAEQAQGEAVALLDVCYGLGYNTAAALETIWRVNPHCRVTVRALEINPRVPASAIANQLIDHWSEPVQHSLTALARDYQAHWSQPSLQAKLLIGDARQTIQSLVQEGFQADAIFLDPFSPPRCPQLWTVDFLQRVAQCLSPQGYLATYSCAAAVRRALQQVGLIIGSTAAAGRRWPGTVASWHPLDGLPLSLRELEHLQTRAAVPYRDPTLQSTATEIQADRHRQQQISELESTGHWRRRWLG